ncbi:ATP-dependent RNA helicase DHX30 isoform X2 [Brienomyrus brachyistius]|uniref:ATP-dependent RNA helicase DHX30 isoform X2 n=1 Tax=Brienomyrus brachyistius TaxID=42636 RepID=UPI0020B2268C|nr:ATP-dependent RNA helicase DHX30 isoform X2 [Brienomyrus brachyistius]
MAASGAALMRVLYNLGGKSSGTPARSGRAFTLTGQHGFGTAVRTGVGTARDPGEPEARRQHGHEDLLKEFPEPKNLLHKTVSQLLGLSDLSKHLKYCCTEVGGNVKRATVTVLGPKRIEVEGFASRKLEAERLAAAAACQKLKELGMLKLGKELPRWRSKTLWKDGEGGPEESPPDILRSSEGEAVRLFPKPKELLGQVMQVATSSSSIRDVVQYQTKGGKVKTCQLTVLWPEKMSFQASAWRRVEAERRAAAQACLRLKEMGLLNEDNKPLSHARYHREKVREMEERERRPHTIDVPEYMEDKMRAYFAKYPVEEDVRKLREEEEKDGLKLKEDTDLIRNAITGGPYRPLSVNEAEALSTSLYEEWRTSAPALREELPVDAHRERVVSAVEAARVTVVEGETGCGKTTRIPRFLLEHHVLRGDGAHCNILVTQPRRISAVSVAGRVAQELGPSLRRHVGYQVRLESRPPEHSGGGLLFLTVGLLLRKLQANAALQGVSHVLVDEVHERDVDTDLLLALLRVALRLNPGLRVVLMSATGDTRKLSRFFGGCRVLQVPGFMHPVRERYLEEVMGEMGRPVPAASLSDKQEDDATPDLDLVVDVIEHIHSRGEPGAVLCFLPGWQDIRGVQERLERRLSVTSSALILPLHSSLPVSEQQAVFQQPPSGQRKIVLATNIAETSITINDIVHVVDTGAHKEQRYDPRTKVSCLDTVWVSRSNVIQRRGRAGRCQPGHAYHLFPRQRMESMETFPIPEILRTPLENLVVQAKIHSPESKAVDFLSQVLDCPDEAAVKDAVSILQEIGVLDETECLTPVGQRVTLLSCDPRLGKVLVLASLFRCVLPLLSVTACLTRDPFVNSLQNRAAVMQARAQLSGSSCSDHLMLGRVVQGWRQTQRDRAQRQDFLDSYLLSGPGLRFIHGLIQQFSENLYEASLVPRAMDCLGQFSQPNQYSHEDELVKAVLLAGLYPNLIQVKRGKVVKGRFRPGSLAYRTRSGVVLLHRSTVNRRKERLPSRWLTFFTAVQSNGKVFVRDSSCIHPLALLLLTDCDVIERVFGERVELSLDGQSLARFDLPTQMWEQLWDLRIALRAMVQRGLQGAPSQVQDGALIALLVDLLNNTEQQASSLSCDVASDADGDVNSDSDVDSETE